MQAEEQKPVKWDVPTEDLYVPPHRLKDLKGKVVWEARSTHPEEKKFINTLQDACYQLGKQNPPKFLIFQDDSPKGYLFPAPDHCMCLSTGLLESLSPGKVQGVIVHELYHHFHPELRRISDSYLPKAVLASIVGSIALSPVFPIALVVEAPVILGLAALSNFVRRRDEFRADATSKDVVGAELIASALTAIRNRQKEITGEQKSFLLKTITRVTDKLIYPLLASHPTDEKRLAKLGVTEVYPAQLPSQEDVVERMEKALKQFRQHTDPSGQFTPNTKRTTSSGKGKGIAD